MTIDIVASNKVKSGMKDEFIALAKELIEKSQAEEGCIFYDLYEDINDGDTVTFIEKWQDQEAVGLHNETEHFKRIVPKLGELVEEQDIRLYKKL